MRNIIAFISLLSGLWSHAQLLDSMALFLKEEPALVVKMDVRGSFVRNEQVKIYGLKLGREHAGRLQYGIGFSMLPPLERSQYIAGVGLVTTSLRMGYVSPYLDYAFYQRGPWEIRLPVQLGIGGGSLSYRDSEGKRRVLERSTLIIYEPVMSVQYRLMRYLGIGGGWGFRLAIHTKSGLGENLSAPIYTFGLRVFFGEIWKELRGEKE